MLVGDGSTGVSDLPHPSHLTNCISTQLRRSDLTTNTNTALLRWRSFSNGDFYTISNSAIQDLPCGPDFAGAYRLNANSILSVLLATLVCRKQLAGGKRADFLAGGGGESTCAHRTSHYVTFTSATLSNPTNLDVGDLIAIYRKAIR